MTTVTSSTAAGAAATPTSSGATSQANQAYTADMFLNLLVTQLKNQDPSSPMDSTQMITQTSQLASMQQLTSLTTATTNSYDLQQRTAAANVLGKTVSWTDSSGVAQSGTATAVSFTGSTPTVTVGGKTIDLADISGISTPATTTSS